MKTYTFHVSLPGTGRTWRKIELREDQALHDLHLMIQVAFNFDNDHLYSFYMSGKAWDQKSEYCMPEGVAPWSSIKPEEIPEYKASLEAEKSFDFDNPEELFMLFYGDSPDALALAREQFPDVVAWAKQFEEDMRWPQDSFATTIADLKLKKGQEFLYLFDYGTEWRFKIKAHAINPDAPDGDYPHIVESVGDPPDQYPDWDFE